MTVRRLLFLDFDGVVADAQGECAAVSWLAGAVASRSGIVAPIPDVEEAVASVPTDYRRIFASIRPWCRTLPDFMIANVLSHPVTRSGWERARVQHADLLLAQARVAQQIRDHWRRHEPDRWVAQHQVRPELSAWLRRTTPSVTIVSAKDAASIVQILRFRGLSDLVSEVVGECSDKRAAVSSRRPAGSTAVFVDDCLDNVLALSGIDGIESWWATWGHHTIEDRARAAQRGVRSVDLSGLDRLQPSRSSGPTNLLTTVSIDDGPIPVPASYHSSLRKEAS